MLLPMGMPYQINMNLKIVGIDASNIRDGGGLTHLIELLGATQSQPHGIERIVVWGGRVTLNRLQDKPWLIKHNPPELNQGLLRRTIWQRFFLSSAARMEGCDVLFVPGGSYAGNFQPVVTISQNLLPFEIVELKRYGLCFFTLKLLLLRLTQSFTFKKADGVIFLTEYARDVVSQVAGKLRGLACLIPHGLNPRFDKAPKFQHNIAEYNDAHPYRILYVSIIDQYKHQWHVVEAIAILRKKGLPIELDLVGPANLGALKRLNATIDCVDVGRHWVHYHGAVAFDELHHRYAQADLGLFASSCENMPNILLEKMASGLPIACSNKGPMLEILGQAGVYFDPEQPDDIARALLELIESPQLRTELSKLSYVSAQKYSWQRCADETFRFLNVVVQEFKGSN
jgi:glycosyltransferase involved in cell wall biosynthesis